MAAVPVYLSILFAIAFASVIVQGDVQENTTQPEIEVVAAPHHVVVEKKASLLLNCSVTTSSTFGPVHYHWLKDGVPLPVDEERNRMQTFSNGSLFIRRIVHRKREKERLSDEGLYECVAGNDNGRVLARRVRVEIAAISKNFTQEPTPVVAHLGGKARFECNIRAIPPATLIWHKDNAPLAHSERFVTLPSGVLQIQEVTQGDAGNYQCLAAQHMYQVPDQASSWKRSRLAALTVLPAADQNYTKVLGPPRNITAVVDDTVIFECLVDGIPVPAVRWRFPKTADKNLSGHHEVVGRTNLRLRNVRAEDAGVYVCVVQKGQGITLEYPATLSVNTYPVIVATPESNSWPVTRTLSLGCEVEGTPKPNILWFFNGTPIDLVDVDKIRYQLTMNDMKLIVFLVNLDNAGYYQCVAENSVGQAMALARIIIFAHKDAPPQPQNVTVTALNSTALMVEWQQEQADLPILTYLITYRRRDGERDQEQQKMVVGNTRVLNITGLFPYTTYIISVRSFTKKASSVQSTSVQGRTLEGVPSAAPMINVDSPQAEVMRVRWADLSPQDQGGVIVRFQLQYRPASSRDALTTIDIEDPKQRSINVTVQANTEYEVRLIAGTVYGFPSLSGGWYLYTTPKPTRVQPQLIVTALNATSVVMYWEAVQLNATSEPLDIGAVMVRRLVDGYGQEQRTVDPPQSSYILAGLEDNTQYEVTAYSSQDPELHATHTFLLSEGSLVPSVHLKCYPLNASTMRLEWSPSAGSTGDAVHYQVCYKEAASTQPLYLTCQDSVQLWLEIGSLKAATRYQFGVRSVTSRDALGTFSAEVTQTSEDKPSPPVNLTYEVLQRGSVRLQWSPPSEPNGVITSYIILYNPERDVPDTLWKNVTKSGQQTIAQVDDLDLKTYFFKMAACTKAGWGHSSTVVVVYPDCESAARCSTSTPGLRPSELTMTDQQIGIIIGVSIGIICIITCVAILAVCHRRCFYSRESTSSISRTVPVHYTNGHVITGNGNGHAHMPLPGDMTVVGETTVPETAPMLSRLPENEQSDAKGGKDIIITPNGVRINGMIKTNDHILPNHLDLSTTSEEKHSLIEAMLAATNGAPHHLPPVWSPQQVLASEDPLSAIDHHEDDAIYPLDSFRATGIRKEEKGSSLMNRSAGQSCGENNVKGGVAWQGGEGSKGRKDDTWRPLTPPDSCTHAGLPSSGCLPSVQGENALDVSGKVGDGGSLPPSPDLGTQPVSTPPTPNPHLAAQQPPATSQLWPSPGNHHYLSTLPLPPPLPPSALPQVHLDDRSGPRGASGPRREEGGVTFAPPQSLPQSASSSSLSSLPQAAAAAALAVMPPPPPPPSVTLPPPLPPPPAPEQQMMISSSATEGGDRLSLLDARQWPSQPNPRC